jgi:20S proteasome alpha/beta subunit
MLPTIASAIDAAMKRNAGTGDSFNIVVIDEKGYQELSEKEKKHLLNA